MKRWAMHILLMLTLGGVTTVGVAWGFAIRAGLLPAEPLIEHAAAEVDDSFWKVSVYGGPGALRIVSEPGVRTSTFYMTGRQVNNSAELIDVPPWSRPARQAVRDEADDFGRFVHDDVFGWPLLCLRSRVYVSAANGRELVRRNPGLFADAVEPLYSRVPSDTVEGGILVVADFDSYAILQRYTALPATVIWRPFTVNWLLFAAVWWVVLFGWRAHLRIVRRWQGYCPLCKYDLRRDIERGCPECGWGRAC